MPQGVLPRENHVEAFVARQPILDTQRVVVAYELLYRTGPENRFPGGETTMAAATVIEQAMGLFGLDVLAPKARAFINMSRRVLVEQLYRVLPTDRVVLEILENVGADEEVLAACDAARAQGYQLALFILTHQLVLCNTEGARSTGARSTGARSTQPPAGARNIALPAGASQRTVRPCSHACNGMYRFGWG